MSHPPSRPSLRFAVPVLLLLLSAATALFVLLENQRLAEQRVEENATTLIQTQAVLLQRALERHLEQGYREGLHQEIGAAATQPNLHLIALTDGMGQVLAASRREWVGKPAREVLPHFRHAAQPGPHQQQGHVHLLEEGNLLYAHYPILLEPAPRELLRARPLGMLTLAHTLGSAKAAAHAAVRRQALHTLLFLLLVASLCGLWYHLHVSRRLDRLVRAAAATIQGEHTPRIPVSGSDELAFMGTALNHLASELNEAGQELQITRERLQWTLQESDVALWDWDLASGSFFLSPNWYALLGTHPSLHQPPSIQDWQRHVHPEDLPQVTRLLQDHLLGKIGSLESRHRVRSPRGREFWILARGQVVNRGESGEPLRFVGTLHDVTSFQELTAQLTEADQRSQQAIRAKSDFLTAISHELRTPLNALLGMAELLAESHLDEEQARYLAIFQHAGENLLDLINDLLELTQVESGRIHLSPAPFNPAEVVEEVAQFFSLRALEKGLTLETRIAPSLPPLVKGDGRRLRQILVNLVGNAIKSFDTGTITLKARPTEEGDESLLFAVEEPGVPPEAARAREILHPPDPAQPLAAHTYQGGGLGLAICRHLVDTMEGTIWLDQLPGGQGSRFAFTLPLPPVQPPAQPDPLTLSPEGPPPLDGMRALVIMEEAEERPTLERLLFSLGVSPTVAHTPGQGWDLLLGHHLNAEPFHILVADSRPWGPTTFQLLERLRRNRVFGLVPVVIIGDAATPALLAESHARHAAFLPLPIKRQALEESLRDATARSRRAREQQEVASGERPLRILLAEDAPDNVVLIKAFLKALPECRLEVAANGAEAVAKWREAVWDLVLMDLQMPVMDGLAATREIRRLEAREDDGRHTPILALTAHAMPEHTHQSLEAGCDDHLIKPIKRDRLLTAIRQHIPRAETTPAPPD